MKPNDKTYIYPTDTVWGIGGSIYSYQSYRDIAKIKKTTEDKPLSILFSSKEQLADFFYIKERIGHEWLTAFFHLETSLLLPVSWLKVEIPFWIYQGSAFVSVRCLENELIQTLVDEVGAPITSTSLNVSGQEPLFDFEEAKRFHKEHCPELHFYEGEGMNLSGSPSTIMSLDESGKFALVRPGRYVQEVMKLCGLSST